MRKLLLACFMLLSVSAALADRPSTHASGNRQQAHATAVQNKNETVAFSDTSSVDSAAVDSASVAVPYTSGNDPSSMPEFDNPFSLFARLATLGFQGVLVAFFVTLIALVLFMWPPILLILLFRYIIKRQKIRAELAREAMKNAREGIPMPQSLLAADLQNDENVWRRGIRTTSVGLGLILLFLFFGAEPMCGVGVLVMCFGLGQMAIAFSSSRIWKKHEPQNSSADVSGSSPTSSGDGSSQKPDGDSAKAETAEQSGGDGQKTDWNQPMEADGENK